MSPFRRIRTSSHSSISYRAAIMCIAALSVLWARSAPPDLPHSSLGLAFHSFGDHDHRQCFDHETAQWATPPSSPLTTLPPVASSHSIHTADILVEFVADGWHYNRPPPVR